jgi:phosphinothricin acetyltransferase
VLLRRRGRRQHLRRPGRRGRGLGRALLGHLVAETERSGIWTLQAGIFAENSSSVLHLHCGFRLVGVREQLGQLDGVWRDVLLLERRAPT